MYMPDTNDQNDFSSSSDYPNSDTESFRSLDSSSATLIKDYWLGKKYFECVLAQNLLRGTSVEESMSSIDSEFEFAIQRFAYDETVDNLRALGIVRARLSVFGQCHGTYETLITLTGSICRQGSVAEKRALLSALRKGETNRSFDARSGLDSSKSQRQPYESPERSNEHQTDGDVGSVADVGYYTSILKEYGDKIRVAPDYKTKTITLVPPQFRATLSFQGSTYDGQASSKKEARHKASKKACERLQLRFD